MVDASLKKSFLWHYVQELKLSQNRRLGRSSEDVAYANWLSRMPYDQNLHGSIKLPDYINQVNSIDVYNEKK